MKKMLMVLCACSLMAFPGCASLRETMASKETQGMVLGTLVGAGAMALGVWAFNRAEGANRLGLWALGGGILGGFVGWCVGHQLEPQSSTAPQ